MIPNIDVIVRRAQLVRDLQSKLAKKWKWPRKPLAQWDKDVSALRACERSVREAASALHTAEAVYHHSLHQLYELSLQGIVIAKVQFRKERRFKKMLGSLMAKDEPRCLVMEAQAWEHAWRRLGVKWRPTQSNTVRSYQKLRQQVIKLERAYRSVRLKWRRQTERLCRLAVLLDKATNDWLEAASRHFAPGSTESSWLTSFTAHTLAYRGSSPSPGLHALASTAAMAASTPLAVRGISPSPSATAYRSAAPQYPPSSPSP